MEKYISEKEKYLFNLYNSVRRFKVGNRSYETDRFFVMPELKHSDKVIIKNKVRTVSVSSGEHIFINRLLYEYAAKEHDDTFCSKYTLDLSLLPVAVNISEFISLLYFSESNDVIDKMVYESIKTYLDPDGDPYDLLNEDLLIVIYGTKALTAFELDSLRSFVDYYQEIHEETFLLFKSIFCDVELYYPESFSKGEQYNRILHDLCSVCPDLSFAANSPLITPYITSPYDLFLLRKTIDTYRKPATGLTDLQPSKLIYSLLLNHFRYLDSKNGKEVFKDCLIFASHLAVMIMYFRKLTIPDDLEKICSFGFEKLPFEDSGVALSDNRTREIYKYEFTKIRKYSRKNRRRSWNDDYLTYYQSLGDQERITKALKIRHSLNCLNYLFTGLFLRSADSILFGGIEAGSIPVPGIGYNRYSFLVFDYLLAYGLTNLNGDELNDCIKKYRIEESFISPECLILVFDMLENKGSPRTRDIQSLAEILKDDTGFLSVYSIRTGNINADDNLVLPAHKQL